MKTVIFVHPGYMRMNTPSTCDPKLITAEREDRAYGSYCKYLKNLERLYNKRENKSSVFVFAMGSRRVHSCHQGFEPRGGDVVLGWGGYYSWKKFRLLTRRKNMLRATRRVIEPLNLADFLLDLDIDDVLIAGEMGPHVGSREGCVGLVYNLISEKMRVRGIEGCIFPRIPYKWRISEGYKSGFFKSGPVYQSNIVEVRENFRFMERMFKDLYIEAVEVL